MMNDTSAGDECDDDGLCGFILVSAARMRVDREVLRPDVPGVHASSFVLLFSTGRRSWFSTSGRPLGGRPVVAKALFGGSRKNQNKLFRR